MPPVFQHHRLSNGLTIIAEVDPTAHTAAAGFYVKTGARDEARAVMGVSHFLEHMMFKGTTDISAEELNRRFDAIGARNNAFTSSEITCFYASVLPEFLGDCLDSLGRMMRPALRDTDFETEKGVILEEIAMYKDNPFWVLYEASLERHFPNHPLGHRVLGTEESIRALTSVQMRGYFEQRYSADNTVVALAGKLDFARTVEQIERLCGHWQPTQVSRDYTMPVSSTSDVRLQDKKVSRAYLLTIAPGPSSRDDRRHAATLLAQVLGAADNSLFHWSLIETGLAEEAQASFSAHDGYGDFMAFASGDADRADEIWEAMTKQVNGVSDSITPDDLERLRNKVLTGATISAERPADRMHRLGQVWTALGEYISLEEDLDRLNRVTVDEVRAVAHDFPLTPVTSGRLMPAAG